MKKGSYGTSTVQYIIIIVLVILAVIPAFYLIGQNVIDYFTALHKGLGGNQVSASSEGTPDNQPPVNIDDILNNIDQSMKQCDGGVCTINFDDISLTGIPENFNEFVETSGASAGTDKMAELIEQLANQLANDGKSEEAKQIMQLANLGHNLAVLQNYAESIVVSCNNDKACIQAEFQSTMNMPDGYNVSASPFPDNVTYEELCESLFDIGRARNYKTENPDEYNTNLSNNRLAYVIVDQFDTIMDNPTIDDSIKGILTELYWDIGTVSEDFDNNLNFLVMDSSDSCEHYDPVTGEVIYVKSGTDPFADFQSYAASKITHFDSSLICGATIDTNADSGTSCH